MSAIIDIAGFLIGIDIGVFGVTAITYITAIILTRGGKV